MGIFKQKQTHKVAGQYKTTLVQKKKNGPTKSITERVKPRKKNK